MSEAQRLYGILYDLTDREGPDPLTLGDMAAAMGARGFGPLFALLAALVALPTGAIPGVPAIVGAALILLAGQLMLGWRTPWLPRKLRNRRIDREKMRAALEKARPMALRLGRIVRARLEFLASGPLGPRVAAAAVMGAGAVMIPLGFIPFLPLLVGLPVLAIGLGLMARDGLVVALGYVTLFAPGYAVFRTLGG